MKIFKIFIFALILSSTLSFSSFANQSVEEIIKGRKAMFSENYQNGKKISILLKSGKKEEAKPLMRKISDNYKKLLDIFFIKGFASSIFFCLSKILIFFPF